MNQRLPFLVAALLMALCSPDALGQEQEATHLQTASWTFFQSEVFSANYGRRVSCPQVRVRKSGKRILDYCKAYPAFEWTLAVENKSGTIATMDYTIEGRMQDVPIVYRLSGSKTWRKITLKKAHFSGEVTKIALQSGRIQLRIIFDPGLVKPNELTASIVDADGQPIETQDWTYDLAKKKWLRSRDPITF